MGGGGQPSSTTTVEEKPVKPLVVQKLTPKSSLYALQNLASLYTGEAAKAREDWLATTRGEPIPTRTNDTFQADLSRTLNLFNTYVPDPAHAGKYITNPDNPYAAADAAHGAQIKEKNDTKKKLHDANKRIEELEKYNNAVAMTSHGSRGYTKPG